MFFVWHNILHISVFSVNLQGKTYRGALFEEIEKDRTKAFHLIIKNKIIALHYMLGKYCWPLRFLS